MTQEKISPLRARMIEDKETGRMTGRLIILHVPDRLAQLHRPNLFARQDQASSAKGFEGLLYGANSDQYLWENLETPNPILRTTVSAIIKDTPNLTLSP